MRSHGVVCIEPPFTFYLSFSLSSKEGSITKQQSSDGAFFHCVDAGCYSHRRWHGTEGGVLECCSPGEESVRET